MNILGKNPKEDEWVSLSDIMTSLMLIFLFIAVYFIVSTKDIIDFPKVFQKNEVMLHAELNKVFSVHDKFHRTLILSGFCLLKIAKISLNSSFFPKPIKR